MARMQFKVGTRYLYQEQVYRVVQVLVNNRVLIENQTFGGQFTISLVELAQLWKDGNLMFEVPPPLARAGADTTIAISYVYTDFDQLPNALREEAWRRYQILLPLLKKPEIERTRVAIQSYAMTIIPTGEEKSIKRNKLGTALSAPSIERWLRAFEQSNYDIRALIPEFYRSARRGEHRLNAEVDNLVQQVLTECSVKRQHRTTDSIFFKVVNLVAEANRSRPATEQDNATPIL